MKSKLLKLILPIIFFISLCGCAAVNVTSSSLKEKGIKEAISDGMIDAAINKEFLNHNINMFMNVEIEVVEGRVLLTGSVKKSKHRMDAIKLSWKVLGVREVINEIDVTEKGGIVNYLTDVKIKTQIRYKVIADKSISSINYNFECVNGALYLIGIAKNKKELKKIMKHANNIKGVTKVISHVIMKDDPRRKKYQRKLQKKEG
jgi:osmotically-inducible protein OsmY